MGEIFIVVLIVAAAVFFMVRRFMKKLKPGDSGGCGGCGGCSVQSTSAGCDVQNQNCSQTDQK